MIKDAIKELKEIQRTSEYDVLCLNVAIHALQQKIGEQINPGDVYYQIVGKEVKKKVCKGDYIDWQPACDVFKSEEDACLEMERRRILCHISDLAQGTDGICQYEMVYDDAQDEIVAVPVERIKPGKFYFMTRDDMHACVLTVGEKNVKKYYFGLT